MAAVAVTRAVTGDGGDGGGGDGDGDGGGGSGGVVPVRSHTVGAENENAE